MKIAVRVALIALIALSSWPLPRSRAVLAADPGEKGEESEGGVPKKKELTEREKRILELFKANEKTFVKDRIHLKYDFERRIEDLVEDWVPSPAQSRNRIRWARGSEGTPTTVEHGIIVSDAGEWIHKAVFSSDIEVTVDLLSVARFRSGNILGPVFFSEKKKRSIGSNGGSQAMCLAKGKHAKPPIGIERTIPSSDRFKIGYKYDGKVLETYVGTRKACDTSKVPKFTEGVEDGHVGLAWSGSIQCFIFSVTIDGTLDPAWVAKELGESLPEKDVAKKSPDKKSTTSKKTSEKGEKAAPKTESAGKKDPPKKS